MDEDIIIIPADIKPKSPVVRKVKEFLSNFNIYEISNGAKLVLYFDDKSNSYYIVCHLDGNTLVDKCDLGASIDAPEEDEDEIYKLNRDITEDQIAFKNMEKDALEGRSFEDMVIEYDTSYQKNKPLKVYGGQHRIRAISKAQTQKGSIFHGVRVYFDLTREQKVEIATINNTSIAVPNDLLDRMREQLLGSELRDWCQKVGLLDKGEDFADRKSPDAPTVRIARTILLNFNLGKQTKVEDFHQPVVCKSGGLDDSYVNMRKDIDWSDDSLEQMGKEYARLHKTQRERVRERTDDNNAEFARKALSLSVAASWAYAAGMFQKNEEHLKNHYLLPDSASAPDDPLNAKALSKARLKGTDPDTYRGLGTRVSSTEMGRMLEVFRLQATVVKRGITKQLANTAIKSFEANRTRHEADKAIGKL
jgi:hypothetical protein